MRRLALISGAVVAILLIAAMPASAKSTGSGSTSTASLTVDNDPPFGGTIALSATFTPVKAVPEESVICTSNGEQVYLNVQTGSGSVSSWTAHWTLWSETWQSAGGGAANCVANLYYYTWQGKSETGITYLASANFAVS
jgi:hypothetical protein